jgi:hypothetical protein
MSGWPLRLTLEIEDAELCDKNRCNVVSADRDGIYDMHIEENAIFLFFGASCDVASVQRVLGNRIRTSTKRRSASRNPAPQSNIDFRTRNWRHGHAGGLHVPKNEIGFRPQEFC